MHPIENPTYLADIRFLFETQDIDCMVRRGIDLRTYEGVKFDATRIYFHLREGSMPPQAARRWPEEQVETFYNWMRNGYPRGVAPQVRDLPLTARGAGRVRRNIANYKEGSEELKTLRKAFEGIIALDTAEPDNPNAYFNVAGIHWLPAPLYCRHHENAYNPWHRVYLQKFEDALRSIDGCADVTLPYWDIVSGKVPDVLMKPPFDKYVFPRDLEFPSGAVFKAKGTETHRHDVPKILQNLKDGGVNDDIDAALGAGRWEDFNGWRATNPQHMAIIRAHDNGHVACGDTLASQAWASFDPLFWFFHCNWDRLWWRWQQLYSGTNLDDFKTLLDGDAYWLVDPVVNGLEPFGVEASRTIDLVGEFDVNYVHPADEKIPQPQLPLIASSRSRQGVKVVDMDRFLVTLSGINRLEIPGSFMISVAADGKTIAKRALFQPPEPKQCATCRKRGVFDISFDVERKDIEGRTLTARIDLVDAPGGMAQFPLSRAGDPELSVRMKMEG